MREIVWLRNKQLVKDSSKGLVNWLFGYLDTYVKKGKGKLIPLQARCGPEDG